jgi:hypothetical protein
MRYTSQHSSASHRDRRNERQSGGKERRSDHWIDIEWRGVEWSEVEFSGAGFKVIAQHIGSYGHTKDFNSLYCTVLCCTVLYCTVLHNTALHCTPSVYC